MVDYSIISKITRPPVYSFTMLIGAYKEVISSISKAGLLNFTSNMTGHVYN